ncbi:hemolysin XhlA family protein [Paenibacillus sp. NPDC058367]|uniref:hemolysin XhlA family protein n=1 Tax=Paenibacillus sp. NPDC058367 TaxID=3346460 RepID=UPI003650FDB0
MMSGGGGVMGTEDKLVEIQIQLARIEKTLEAVPALASTIEATRDLAREAIQSTKSAHHRLDRIEDAQRWLWRTVGGAIITVIIGAIVVAIRMGGN